MKKIIVCMAIVMTSMLTCLNQCYAVDGVVEINQTCATQTGCFSGDALGYPITIDGSAGHSYRLTSDLILANENNSGINIKSSNTKIDLNGFEIIRSACIGSTSACIAFDGEGKGIYTESSSNITGVSISDGSITGMGKHGIDIDDVSRINDVNVKWNRRDGITCGASSIIKNNIAHHNGYYGITASGSGSMIEGNTAYENGYSGIGGNKGSVIKNNTSYSNVFYGIISGFASNIYGNTAFDNEADGIFLIQGGGYVHGNVVRDNNGYGLKLGVDTAYRENVITDNFAGTVEGGYSLFSNFCETNQSCP